MRERTRRETEGAQDAGSREAGGRRLVIVGAAWMSLAGCSATPEAAAPTPVVAAPPPEAAAPTPVVAAEPAAAPVVVTVWPHEQGVRAVFELPAPTRSVQLLQQDAVGRDTWRVVTAGAQMIDGVVTSAEPLTQFEVVIAPDPVEGNRVYPSVHRVGKGVAIYGPSLMVAQVDTRVMLRPEAGGVAIPEHGPETGYAYLGPAEAVKQGQGVRVVAGDDAAPWLVDRVRDEAEVALAFYRKQLERPGREPTILVAASPGPQKYRGDSSDTAVISLRFVDVGAPQPDLETMTEVASFVRHETFHLWNAPRSATPPWLHEGGAEYATIVSAVSAGVLTHEQGVAQVSRHLARCSEHLGERGFLEVELTGQHIYRCGVALQWVADVEARGRSQGQRDTFAIWRDLLRASDAGGYSVDDFRAATGPAVAIMLDASGPQRWAKLAEALDEHGATISNTGDAVTKAPPLAR